MINTGGSRCLSRRDTLDRITGDPSSSGPLACHNWYSLSFTFGEMNGMNEHGAIQLTTILAQKTGMSARQNPRDWASVASSPPKRGIYTAILARKNTRISG